MWPDGAGRGMLSGAAPFYRTYACADDKFVGVGAIEPQFWAALLSGLGLSSDPDFAEQRDPRAWPAQIAKLEALFAERSRDDWAGHFAPEACVSPVLTFDEAAAHPHNVARGTFDGGPMPAPLFSATPAAKPRTSVAGADTAAVLAELKDR
jgi:alpha-methylacyl-CoA racemase